jgi:hypothetical protein
MAVHHSQPVTLVQAKQALSDSRNTFFVCSVDKPYSKKGTKFRRKACAREKKKKLRSLNLRG